MAPIDRGIYSGTDDPSQVRAIPAPVDVAQARLTIPVVMFLMLLATVVGGVVSLTDVYNRLSSHAKDPHVHVNAEAAVNGGGVAYKNDIRDERQRMRALLKSMEISCTRGPRGDTMTCRVYLPEGP